MDDQPPSCSSTTECLGFLFHFAAICCTVSSLSSFSLRLFLPVTDSDKLTKAHETKRTSETSRQSGCKSHGRNFSRQDCQAEAKSGSANLAERRLTGQRREHRASENSAAGNQHDADYQSMASHLWGVAGRDSTSSSSSLLPAQQQLHRPSLSRSCNPATTLHFNP